MVFGKPTSSAIPTGPVRLAVVGHAEIEAARSLLTQLAARFKGSDLTPFQARQVAQLAPAVALRRKRGLTPVLTQAQALTIWRIIAPSATPVA